MSEHAFTPQPVPTVTIDWLQRVAIFAASVVLFFVCFSLNQRHHRFPYYYHPDEPGKVEQVLTGKFNYHHPMLLLAATCLAADVLHTPHEKQAVVEVGRGVSAAFVAGAIVMLALMAYLWRGWRAGLVAGAALTFHHQLYELSHYMKEDSALLFGVAWVFLASLAYFQRASLWRAAVLGAGCALAISGKYIGVAMLGVALPVLWVHSRNGEGKRHFHFLAFAGGILAVLIAVNFSLLAHYVTFRDSFQREWELVKSGQGDATRRVPHALYWNVLIDNTTPAIWLLVVSLISVCYQRWERLGLPQKILLWFPFLFGFALSFSPKENDRYFLPATAALTLMAAVGAESLPYLLSSIWRSWDVRAAQRLLSRTSRFYIWLGASILLVTLQVTGWSSTKPGWSQYDAAFVRDDINALIQWMNGPELDAEAVVVADSRTGLPNVKRKKNAGRGRTVRQKLTIAKYASNEGTLDELRAKGVTHVVISESSYGRFFRGDLRPKDDKKGAKQFEAARQFYEELLQRNTPIFERERGTVIYLHPGIRVYRLQPAPLD